jgi:esterase/lipase superfamily enzyme
MTSVQDETRQIWRWHSPHVGQTMGVARWGHHGKPVLFFPTGGGDFLDTERFLMVRALQPLLDAGRIKLYAVDSVDRWGWANRDNAPREKSALQVRYDEYLVQELFPFVREDCGGTPQKFAVAGASLGAYHAVNSGSKHPEQIDLAIGMSGTYQMNRRMNQQWNEDWYFNAPDQFLPNLGETEAQLAMLRQSLFVLALGVHYENPAYTDVMADTFSRRGIPHRVVRWGGHSGHDWPTWRTMLPLFLDKLV